MYIVYSIRSKDDSLKNIQSEIESEKLIFLFNVPLQKYYNMCVMCIWIRSVLDSWLKRLQDFYLFHILLLKFVLLSLLCYIRGCFECIKENKLCHNLLWHSLFCCLYQNRHGKILLLFFGKIYWHTFCRFLCQKCLYSNVINQGNLF